MFEIGFQELLLVGVVALLVFGPERLPEAMRTFGLWLGRARRTVNRVWGEVERELGADEIRRQLHNESILDETRRLQQELKSVVNGATSDLRKVVDAGAQMPWDGVDSAPPTAVASPSSPAATLSAPATPSAPATATSTQAAMVSATDAAPATGAATDAGAAAAAGAAAVKP